MFANSKFTARKAEKFHDSFTYESLEEEPSIPYLTTYIVNDYELPPKSLIAVDIYDIPHDAEGKNAGKYDYIHGVSVLPEDAIKLVRQLNVLISAIFDEMNHRK